MESPARQRVLEEVRRFKASWVGLAEALSAVEGPGAWRAWGFEDFGQYCRKELHLRVETAHKLTRSFAFLAARRDGGPALAAAAPPLDVVDLLARAPAASQLPQEAYQATVSEVLGGAPVSRGQLLRRLRRHDPTAFRGLPPEPGGEADPAADVGEPAAAAPPPVDAQALRKTLALAARLVELVEDLSLGALPGRHARAVVRELQGRVAEAQRAGAA